MRNLRPTLIMMSVGLLSAAVPVSAQHFCDDPPVLSLLTGETVTVSGLNSQGHPTGTSWYVTAPGASVPTEPTSRFPTTEVDPVVPGLWSIALVADYQHQAIGGGLWSSETCVTIKAASVISTIALADPQVAVDEALDVNGHDSRWAVGVTPIVQWLVDGLPFGSCNGGPPPSNPDSLDCTVPANWLSPGWHTAGLRLTDPSSGQISLSTADFEVIEIIPLSVSFTWSPSEPDPTDLVTFTATVTPATPEQDFTRVIWELGDGYIETYTSCPPPYFNTCLQYPYIYAEDGWFDVSVTVETTDETASQGHRVKIGDPIAPPTAGISLNPLSPLIMQTTTFSLDGECDGNCQWSWDFGDGAQSTVQNPTHIWLVPGTYTVSLTVSNESGIDSASVPVDVATCWVPPTPLQDGTCFGGPVSLTAAPGSAWLWDNGSTTQSVSAVLGGARWVNIDDGADCWGNAPVSVALENCGDPDGDANLDGNRDAADLGALVVEITDGDGDAVSDSGNGDLTAPGGDVTGDWRLRVDDLLTLLVNTFQ